MKANCVIVFFFLISPVQAQELIPMGSWRSHFNYEQTTLVEKTAAKIFATSSKGLISYDLEDLSINKLSKVDGLSDVGITALAYDASEGYLSLGYQNGNIDIITAEGIQNLPVLLNSDVTDNKTINHISFYNGKMNVSTDFGLLVLTSENKVEEAYQNLSETGQTIEVRSSAILNDVMYIATEDGVLAGQLTSGDNLQDFNNWERFLGDPVHGVDVVSVASTNGNAYAATTSSLFKLAGTSWEEITVTLNTGEGIHKIREGSTGLLVLTDQRAFILNASNVFSEIYRPPGAMINDMLQESETIFWYADQSDGLTRLEGTGLEHIVLDGPVNNIDKLKIENGDVYAFPALANDFSAPISNDMGYSIFKNGVWTSTVPSDIAGFSNITDVLVINDQRFIASFGQGIQNLSTDQITNYTNSPLDENQSGTGNTLVSGMALDEEQNIWVANFSNNSLLKWNGNESWEQFDFGSSAAAEPMSIGINQNNQVWMSLGHSDGRGILAYDIEAEASRYITTTATSLPSNEVHDIAFGKNGEVWFATDRGVAYLRFSFGVVEDQSIDVTLPENFLFEDKKVYALAIDGGNRIWMGTQDGLWLFGENISELIEHFTVDNSPLPSNQVIDLAIHPTTGELFVATEEGLVSYRTNATEATNKHQQVQIYPNPVLPDFDGWVGMSGLASDVRLKITTVSGRLIREIDAAGGGASWDVTDYLGRRVSTGIYLVFSASRDGSETFVGKIAVID